MDTGRGRGRMLAGHEGYGEFLNSRLGHACQDAAREQPGRKS
jgi:hypothetical protein